MKCILTEADFTPDQPVATVVCVSQLIAACPGEQNLAAFKGPVGVLVVVPSEAVTVACCVACSAIQALGVLPGCYINPDDKHATSCPRSILQGMSESHAVCLQASGSFALSLLTGAPRSETASLLLLPQDHSGLLHLAMLDRDWLSAGEHWSNPQLPAIGLQGGMLSGIQSLQHHTYFDTWTGSKGHSTGCRIYDGYSNMALSTDDTSSIRSNVTVKVTATVVNGRVHPTSPNYHRVP